MTGHRQTATRKGTTPSLRVLLALAGAAALLSCANLNDDPGDGGLAAAQARWQSLHLTRYVFQFQHNCFCAPEVTRPVSITVVGGVPVSAVYVDSGTAADTTLFQQYLTVDRIFTFLHNTINAHPALLTATYDHTLGYPLQVYVDPIALAADDEVTLHIQSLTVAP